jgi:hypothetical protein
LFRKPSIWISFFLFSAEETLIPKPTLSYAGSPLLGKLCAPRENSSPHVDLGLSLFSWAPIRSFASKNSALARFRFETLILQNNLELLVRAGEQNKMNEIRNREGRGRLLFLLLMLPASDASCFLLLMLPASCF